MALPPGIGTITIETRTEDTNGTLKLFKCSFDGDSSYRTGGTAGVQEELRAAIATAAAAAGDANVRGPEAVTIVDVIPGDCGDYRPCWDFANQKLKVLEGGDPTWDEVSAGSALFGTTFHVTFVTV
jgi:hypothetical protein